MFKHHQLLTCWSEHDQTEVNKPLEHLGCCDYSCCSRAVMCCLTSPGSASEQDRITPLIPLFIFAEGRIYKPPHELRHTWLVSTTTRLNVQGLPYLDINLTAFQKKPPLECSSLIVGQTGELLCLQQSRELLVSHTFMCQKIHNMVLTVQPSICSATGPLRLQACRVLVWSVKSTSKSKPVEADRAWSLPEHSWLVQVSSVTWYLHLELRQEHLTELSHAERKLNSCCFF